MYLKQHTTFKIKYARHVLNRHVNTGNGQGKKQKILLNE